MHHSLTLERRRGEMFIGIGRSYLCKDLCIADAYGLRIVRHVQIYSMRWKA